jgi:hypothetical protein
MSRAGGDDDGESIAAMISDSNDILIDPSEQDGDADDAPRAGAAVAAPLPEELVLTERAAATLRAYLVANGLAHYRIFFGCDTIYDIEKHLDALGEVAAWEAVAPMVHGGEIIHAVTQSEETGVGKLWETGILRLARAEVVLGRWYWANRDSYAYTKSLWLCAAPSAEHYARLRTRVLAERHKQGGAVWQIVRSADDDDTRTPRDASAADDVVLPPALRQRLETDVIGFFGNEVAALYRALKVPYRRGVLLYGPPGNGKTSLIRYVGARLLHVPVMLLRAAAQFTTDDLEEILRRWREQAPAILVIEDLDWLLERVNVSTLLNLLDGVDSTAGGGLLLIATTNNPEKLDPAINNRPGRFDVVIEIDRPDRPMRLELLRRKLPEIEMATIERLADATNGLSFAHVLEILRLSGFAALAERRTQRTEADLLAACATVRAADDEARRGFPPKLDLPFGIHHRRKA